MKRLNKFYTVLMSFLKNVSDSLLKFLEIVILLFLRVLIRNTRKILRYCSRKGTETSVMFKRLKNSFGEVLYKYGEMIFSSDSIIVYTEKERMEAAYVIETKAKTSPVEMSWEYNYSDIKCMKWISDFKIATRKTVFQLNNRANHLVAKAGAFFAVKGLFKRINTKTNLDSFQISSGHTTRTFEFQQKITNSVIDFFAALKQMIEKRLHIFTKPETTSNLIATSASAHSDEIRGVFEGERLYYFRE